MAIINEKSTARLTISPLDEDGKPFTPDTARYKLNDKTTGTEIIGWTVISPTSQTMTIQIPAGSNAIIDGSLELEPKVLTVETDYGTDDAHNEDVEYQVRNKLFVS